MRLSLLPALRPSTALLRQVMQAIKLVHLLSGSAEVSAGVQRVTRHPSLSTSLHMKRGTVGCANSQVWALATGDVLIVSNLSFRLLVPPVKCGCHFHRSGNVLQLTHSLLLALIMLKQCSYFFVPANLATMRGSKLFPNYFRRPLTGVAKNTDFGS